MSSFSRGRRKVKDLSGLAPEEQKEYYKNRLLYFLERPKTLREAKRFLKEIACPADWAEELTAFAESYGFIDDAAYAQAFIHDSQALKYYSRRQIRQQLSAKGVASDTVEELLEESGVSDEAVAAVLANRRLKNAADPEARHKCAAFLVRRGFAYETVKKVLPDAEACDEAFEPLFAPQEY